MSCHDIGRGLNEVTKKVTDLYDKGEINVVAAKEIIKSCGRAVNWCDGNVSEAIDYIRHNRGAECFQKIPRGKPLYSLWNLNYAFQRPGYCGEYRDIQEEADTPGDIICENCINGVIERVDLNGKDIDEIIEKAKTSEVSIGDNPDKNNDFFTWPDRCNLG